jgi:hypothetical protein
MEDRRYLNLNELLVWSDNPRNGRQNDNNISETEAINILIEVVGNDKMYNLIEDIYKSKKLMGNVNPVVVYSGEKYLVYDGNRRISSLKVLKKPSLIESEELRSKVERLINKADVSFADRVFVYITNEKEALEIMDKTHSGEQEGVGMISWEAYQRDISLYRRGKTPMYSHAYSVAQALNYNIKSFDTKTSPDKIPYTDLNRIFGSKKLKDHFSLAKEKADYEKKAKYIIGMLIKYKKQTKFVSFSRQFNTTEKPIADFCKWVDEQEKTKKNYYFKSNPIELFIDESFRFELLQFEIHDEKQKKISFKIEDLNISYRSPKGNTSNKIDTKIIGKWEIHLEFNDEQHIEIITIQDLFTPKIDFEPRELFIEDNTIDLRKLIIRATNGHGKDRKNDVEIKSKDGEIIKDIFTTKNPKGVYHIAYSFLDVTGAPFSKTKKIIIAEPTDPLHSDSQNAPLLSYDGKYSINISDVVNRLVSEINGIDFESNICIISTSLRALIELSFDKLHTEKIVQFSNNNLEKRIVEFKTFLIGKELTNLQKNNNAVLTSYNTEENRLNQIDPKLLSSYLNLATHKSIAAIDTTKITEIARKSIVPILVYTSLLLKEHK